MRKISLCLVALFASLVGTQVINAQENGNRDENNKIVRGPYLTNKAGANWWINLGGGITVFGDGGYTPRVTPVLDFSFGKWFTPTLGARVGYQGLTGSVWSKEQSAFAPELNADKNKFKSKFGYSYVHGDVMLNISNLFSGYKETRFWDVIPYVHAGLLTTYKKSADVLDNEFAVGAGIYNTMRLSRRVSLSLDVRGIILNGRQLQHGGGVAGELSASLGVVVNLGKTGWIRASNYVSESSLEKIATLEFENEKLASEKESLENEKAALAKDNARLAEERDRIERETAGRVGKLDDLEPSAFYFEIGRTKLSKKELAHLDFHISSILPKMNESKVVVFTASADSKTGSRKRNEYLTQERIKFLQNLLVEKYGLDTNEYEYRYEIVDSGEPELDRAVVISFR